MIRSLVTGGAGFLGSHLCKRLIEEGHTVIAMDNLYTGRLANIEPLMSNPAFKFIEHDITEPFSLEVDYIYNLACPASPVHYQAKPIETTRTSVLGALNCLEVARANKARILQASTSEVYGDPQVHPQPESYQGSVNPIGIRACYDEGKRCAESLFFDYYRVHQVDIRVIRIFNTYGPQMLAEDGRVISNFIIQALKGIPITIYGKGEQTRSFCYVDDLIEGIVRMMSQTATLGPVNLGNPAEFTVGELADLILELTQSKSALDFRPLPEDDPKQRQPDIHMAEKYLAWKPKVSLKEGIMKTIEFFKKDLNS